jgi:hypothetical protein
LAQVQGDLIEQRSTAERENLSLQAKWDEEKAQLQQSKEMVHRALRSVTIVEVKIEERVPQQVAQLEEVIQ